MRGMKLMAVCGVLAAGAAGAQEQASGSGAAGEQRWSVGAGAGLTAVGNNPLGTGNITPRASLEYLFAEDTALVLGGFGTFGVSWANGNGSTIDGGIGANLGVRKYLASASANRLSLHGLFNVGFRDKEGAASDLETSLSAGFAVDHALAEALTLRGSVDVASFGFNRDAGTNRVGLDFYIAPSLELRFAF